MTTLKLQSDLVAIELGEPQTITATSPAAVIDTSGVTSLTYYLTIYNDGADPVSVWPGSGAGASAGAKRIPKDGSITIGPLITASDPPRLYAANPTLCTYDIDEAVNEV